MSPRRALGLTLEVAAVLVVASLLLGQVLGQPVLLSYVETGSMAPTLDAGDGFVAVPTAVAGPVEEDDVVVFEAREVGGGGLTTHRVVGETDRGYVTRGDANPFTDQDGAEPPVQDAQVVAKGLTIGGRLVVVPELGTAVMGVQGGIETAQRWLAVTLGTRSLLGPTGFAYGLLGLSAVAYVVDLLVSGSAGRRRERDVDRRFDRGISSRLVLAGLAGLLVVTATAAMTVPAGTQEFGVVSAEFDSDSPTVIRQGESNELTYRVPNAGLVPVYAHVEPASDGVDTDPSWVRVDGRSETNVSLALSAPPETGYYQRYVHEHRYLAVLPRGVVQWLAAIHPWLPVVVVDAALGGGLYLFGRLLVEDGRLRFRSRETRHDRPAIRRLLRWLYR